jgi:hypothetical protein
MAPGGIHNEAGMVLPPSAACETVDVISWRHIEDSGMHSRGLFFHGLHR